MRTAFFGVLAAAFAAPGIAGAADNPALSTEWKEFNITLENCKRRA